MLRHFQHLILRPARRLEWLAPIHVFQDSLFPSLPNRRFFPGVVFELVSLFLDRFVYQPLPEVVVPLHGRDPDPGVVQISGRLSANLY